MLSGFVGVGDAGRGNRSHEHFFLNGRAMKSPILSSAVETACRQRVTIGRFPLCVLHLTMPFENADVNVHPNKWEVRFQDERRVREAVETIIFEALAKTDAAPPIPPMYLPPENAAPAPAPAKIQVSQPAPPPEDAPPALKKPDSRLSAFTEDGALPVFAPPSPKRETAPLIPPPAAPSRSVMRDSGASLLPPRTELPAQKPREETQKQANAPHDEAAPIQTSPVRIQREAMPTEGQQIQHFAETIPLPEPEQVQAPMVEAAFRQIPLRVLGVAFNTYIIMEYGDLLILSDQHAVHERLLYEQFMRETAAAPASQALLIPLIVSLSPAEYACYEENRETLEKAGFDLAPFGDGTVQLRGVPIVLGQPQAESCLLEALDELAENPSLPPADRTSRVIQMACKHAVKGGERLPEESVKQLIRDVIEQKVTPTCPHGRPLMVQITRNELEKRFRRIQS
jgi:DNA mismatch repair protein MutL